LEAGDTAPGLPNRDLIAAAPGFGLVARAASFACCSLCLRDSAMAAAPVNAIGEKPPGKPDLGVRGEADVLMAAVVVEGLKFSLKLDCASGWGEDVIEADEFGAIVVDAKGTVGVRARVGAAIGVVYLSTTSLQCCANSV